jgi:hypothetical protein
MFSGIFRQTGRCSVAGLAFVAASYHLTETAHRQADLARQQRQAQQVADRSQDEQDESNPRQILEWLAPDMLERAGLRTEDLDRAIRRTTDAGPALSPSDRLSIDPLHRRTDMVVAAVDSRRTHHWTHLSDRSTHGPPSRG